MTTLEQELEALIESTDYRVIIFARDSYLKLRLIYTPRLNVIGNGGLAYIANGVIAEQHFIHRKPEKRWKQAREWVLGEIKGHRELITAIGQL